MTYSSPQAKDTAAALRSALGPGYGFGGPSDRLIQIVAGKTAIAAADKRRQH